MKRVAHCYLSPSGSTRKAGRKICSYLEEAGYETSEFDLARFRGRERELKKGISESSLLLVGSPVYANHAAGPVASLLNSLEQGSGRPALAYVTYGGVSKGSSLYEIAGTLDRKGYRVIGLAEVLAVHSMMFREVRPVGCGHPGAADWETLAAWVRELVPRLDAGGAASMRYEVTRPPRLFERVLDSTVFTPRLMRHFWPSIHFDPEKCTQCGACASSCPNGRLDGLPQIDESTACLYCYQCVRRCPGGALDASMGFTGKAVRMLSRAKEGRDGHATRVYK